MEDKKPTGPADPGGKGTLLALLRVTFELAETASGKLAQPTSAKLARTTDS